MDELHLPLAGNNGLIDLLWRVPDPRGRQGMRYSSRALLATAICAVLSGARSFKAIGFRRGGIASETAIRRFLGALDGDRLSAIVGGWFEQQLSQLRPRALAGDGKTLRGSADGASPAVQLASVVTHEDAMTLGQTVIADGNEIGAMQRLLASLDIAGATITLDALHTQKDTAILIVRVKQADYVMTVKGNQPTLLWEIEHAPSAAFSPGARRV